jgi:enamine deaminase RidA (YjgF/YER057c/UK114 family)
MRTHLEAAGSSLARVVRLDQYYPDPAAVDPYHVARKQALAGQVAPSTSVIVGGLLNTDALMDVQVMASTLDSGYGMAQAGSLNAPSSSGYAPCIRSGDMIFVAGQLARDATGQLAAEAMPPPGQLWNGTRITLETRYLIEQRLRPALAAAESDFSLVLKAQVYLSQAGDFAAFWQVWSQAFGGRVPPTTVVVVDPPAFGTAAATIEVNLVAAHASARGRIVDVDCDVELVGPGMMAARRFDGVLFVAGLMALQDGGLAATAQVDPAMPYFDDGVSAQMAEIQARAKTIFEAAGTDLAHIVRAIHFHSALADFRTAYLTWDAALRRPGMPFSAVQVANDLLVPGAQLIVDLWGHVAD